MKLKTIEVDGKRYALIQDDKPVYVHDDGREIAFDAPQAVGKISALNREAQSHREGKEAAETKLQLFAGIDDPEAARTAIATVKNLSDKKLVEAGEVDKVKAEAIKAVRAEFEPIVSERDKLRNDLHAEKIGGAFSRSKFIADKLTIPPDLVEARFGKAFEIKDGKVVAKDSNGQVIYSRVHAGEVADFDEALETLVNGYPQRSSILKGSGGGGGGAPASGGSGGGDKTLTRQQFEALDQPSRATKMREGFKVVDAA